MCGKGVQGRGNGGLERERLCVCVCVCVLRGRLGQVGRQGVQAGKIDGIAVIWNCFFERDCRGQCKKLEAFEKVSETHGRHMQWCVGRKKEGNDRACLGHSLVCNRGGGRMQAPKAETRST